LSYFEGTQNVIVIRKAKPQGLQNTFFLSAGNHASPEEGLCAMELVAFLEGLPHSDHPRCTCQIISAFVRGINDNMPDDIRQGLLKYLPRLVGTVSEQHEQERHEFFAWQTIKNICARRFEGQKIHAYGKRTRSFRDFAGSGYDCE
jgi:hypothetical protein